MKHVAVLITNKKVLVPLPFSVWPFKIHTSAAAIALFNLNGH